MTIDYSALPTLAEIYLEDSFVLEISENSNSVSFRLEAVLTRESPRYRPPKPNEQYCYAMGSLIFDQITQVDWISRTSAKYTDAAGETDLGNIDTLDVEPGSYHLTGDWGDVRIFSPVPPTFRFDE